MYKLKGLLKYADKPDFQAKWMAAKQKNKERLAVYARETLGVELDTKSLFDVQIKVCLGFLFLFRLGLMGG